MSLLRTFVSYELTTQLRSTRFRVLAIAYVVIASIPSIALYHASARLGYIVDTGAYAHALRALLPALTALFAGVLAVDAITREREEGSLSVVALAPLSASGYIALRWLALVAIAAPLTVMPSAIAAALASHANGRIGDLAPLAWEWLLHVAPPLLVMSALMLALGTITGRTILAILAYGFAMTFGLGFLQDLLAFGHRHLEGPGEMVGFDSLTLARLVWTARGWWHFDPPTAAGYPIETELDAFLPQAAMLVAATLFFFGVTPAFLRRTRRDVRPWRIREDHPLRTMFRALNRVREEFSPDAGLQPADRIVLVIGAIAATACVALLLVRETRFIQLAHDRYAAEQAPEPNEMSVDLVPRAIRVEGQAGRTIRTRTTFEFENRGARAERHLAFAVHPGLSIERVSASCGNARVTRAWERVGIDLDQPIAPQKTCSVAIDLNGQPDGIVFNLQGGGRFGGRYRRWQLATKPIDLSDLSRSTFVPAATSSQLLLTASDFAPVPRYTPWQLDGEHVDRHQDTTSFVPERVAPAAVIRVALRLPEGFTAADSCGTVSERRLDSGCTFPFAKYRLTAARFTNMSFAGRATLLHLRAHGELARIHAPAIAEAMAVAERAWPGLAFAASPTFVERPTGPGDDNFFYPVSPLLEASGAKYFIPEPLFIQRKPLDSSRIAAAIISSTLQSRRHIAPAEQQFVAAVIEEVARARAGGGEARSATLPRGGPIPSTEPLMNVNWRGSTRTRLRGVLVDLEYRAGADRVVEGINEFVSRKGAGTAKELIDTIGRRAGLSLDTMYRDYVLGTALPKLTIEDATFVRDGNRWIVRGFAHNIGTGETFCPIVLRTQAGAVRQTLRIGSGERVPFTLTTDHEPRTLQLDPDRVVYRHPVVGTVDAIDYTGES